MLEKDVTTSLYIMMIITDLKQLSGRCDVRNSFSHIFHSAILKNYYLPNSQFL